MFTFKSMFWSWGVLVKLGFSLGCQTTVFKAEVYTIKACIVENLEELLE
jgi:hypothetical protein